jgi:hypothetical protein
MTRKEETDLIYKEETSAITPESNTSVSSQESMKPSISIFEIFVPFRVFSGQLNLFAFR